jgi:hypothetical protein
MQYQTRQKRHKAYVKTLTNSPAREDDFVIRSPSYVNRRLNFPEIDATEQGVARLKVAKEMAVGVCGIWLRRVLGGLGGLLRLLDHRIISGHDFMGNLDGWLHHVVM